MTKKQSSWIWFLLAILPIVLIIIANINTGEYGNIPVASCLNTMGFETEYSEISTNIALGTGQTEEYIYKYDLTFTKPYDNSLEEIIYEMQKKLMLGTKSDSYFLPQYIAYLIRLYIIKIAFDVFLLLPKICNRLINKAIGSSEVE